MLGEHTKLSDEEVASAASVVAMTCGMLLLSDDLPNVNHKRMQIVSKIIPLTGIPAVVLDLHSTREGFPCLMRLWCTDKYDALDSFRQSMSMDAEMGLDHNAEATFFARQISFSVDAKVSPASERRRTCIHVTKGLGTWTIVSISNWLDKATVVHIPPTALLPMGGSVGEKKTTTRKATDSTDGNFFDKSNDGDDDNVVGIHGYHTFGFWSSKYSWLPDHRQGVEQTISRKLNPHETEIYHVKPVTPDAPQYIGSDLHFSCGKEVRSFLVTKHSITITLDTSYHRVGRVFVFLPRMTIEHVRVTVGGSVGRCTAVGNTPKVSDNGSPRLAGRIVQIPVVIHSDGRPQDGEIVIEY